MKLKINKNGYGVFIYLKTSYLFCMLKKGGKSKISLTNIRQGIVLDSLDLNKTKNNFFYMLKLIKNLLK